MTGEKSMIDVREVAAFFDRLAPSWDDDMVRDEAIIGTILDNAEVTKGKTVLDVACGTGVLIPDYLARGAASVTAIDLSEQMVEIARAKFAGQRNVTVLCADAHSFAVGRKFDCIVIYNAFPHFAEPERLIGVLSDALNPGGTLTVAHGMSREMLLQHHKNVPAAVSSELMPADALAAVFAKTLRVTTALSDDRMYQVTGKKCGIDKRQ